MVQKRRVVGSSQLPTYKKNGMAAVAAIPWLFPTRGDPGVWRAPSYWSGAAPAGAPFCVGVTAAVSV